MEAAESAWVGANSRFPGHLAVAPQEWVFGSQRSAADVSGSMSLGVARATVIDIEPGALTHDRADRFAPLRSEWLSMIVE